MHELISQWLTDYGISPINVPIVATLFGVLVNFVIAALCYYIVKHRVIVLLHDIAKRTKNTWDDLLFNHQVFLRIAQLVPFVVLLFLVPLTIPTPHIVADIIIIFAKVAITFKVARCISALLDVIKEAYRQKAHKRYVPLNATIQVIKLLVYLVATILAVSVILNRSPIYLLSGLGALTAVLILVFQDTIKGLVASIQISANRMVTPGDWVEMPQYGADGDVLEIGLNTVKIQNFDRTVTTVPTYALTSSSFKNWRDMFASGGRRIKRAIAVDVASVKFLSKDEISELANIQILAPYIEKKQQELSDHANQKASNPDDQLNVRQLTNIGTFRAYITAYLKQHEQVHPDMTCMVRQLQAGATGIPLELYFFSKDQNWAIKLGRTLCAFINNTTNTSKLNFSF